MLVAPPHRRRGLGARLLRHVTAQAVDAGRTQLALGTTVRPGAAAAGREFLRAAGARLALVERRRRLTLPPAEPQTLRDLGERARRASPGLSAGAVDRADPAGVARRARAC